MYLAAYRKLPLTSPGLVQLRKWFKEGLYIGGGGRGGAYIREGGAITGCNFLFSCRLAYNRRGVISGSLRYCSPLQRKLLFFTFFLQS